MNQKELMSMVAGITLMVSSAGAQKIQYPETRKGEQTDTYFGTEIADPYRWLEDDRSEQTAKWVEAQNKVTFSYLEKIPYRNQIKNRLSEILNYPRYSQPFRKNDTFFFYKNDGLQNQSVLYIQKGLNGTPEVLIDPNKFSEDGTVALAGFELSKDGKYAAYGISKGGSDWREFKIMEIATRKTLPETLNWIKSSGISWQGDGFYYTRYPEPEKGSELSSVNEKPQVYYHKAGTPQSEDQLVYEDPKNPQRFIGVYTSEDENWEFLSLSERGKRGNALFFRAKGETEFKPIVENIGDSFYGIIDTTGDKFLILTNREAPNARVVLVDTQNTSESDWKTIIAEKPDPLRTVSAAGGKLFVTYLKDVSSRVYVHDYSGKLENEVKLPGIGTAGGFGGERDDKFVFYSFTSFNYPSAIFRYDIGSKKSSVFRESEIKNFKSSDYEVKQVFYKSKDGTRIPMFIVHKKGLKLNGNNPTLLNGYGGFNVTQMPYFGSLRIAWLEQGGVFAVANLRGGGEYGEKWHLAGMKQNRQNVFDDFIAAAEYLIANKYTSPKKLAIQGGSNGGLLVGAVINQRPDLFGAAIPEVGVMDMLRFHKFTVGWAWVTEYGSSDNEEDFKNIYKYSPLHNIREDIQYPPVLVTTADHDDRVVPAHSFKYIATLQEKYKGDNPVLIRVDTKSGHGASNTTKMLEEQADIYAFLFHTLGVNPKYKN